LEWKIAEVKKMWQAALRQLETIEALPAAVLRRVFDVQEPKL